ncbi:hypothetical protein P12x_003117 [Tundrisphaera lichenicola]|uniref:hypothetical protein n=1 Tax=Tundrisphaera lichenicola TaxID=2029860 RepID=UPI003EC111D0
MKEAEWLQAGERNTFLLELKSDRDNFDARAQMPKSKLLIETLIEYQLFLQKTRRPLIMAYEELIKALTDANRLDEARPLVIAQKALDREAGGVPGFVEGSLWKGERFADVLSNHAGLTQASVPFSLRVIKVEGDKFWAEAYFHNVATASVQGVFNGIGLEWETVEMIKSDGGDRKWTAEGVVLGPNFYCRFRGVNINPTTGFQAELEGYIRLYRAP